MINGRNIFDQPIKKDLISYGKIPKFQLAGEMITQLAVY